MEFFKTLKKGKKMDNYPKFFLGHYHNIGECGGAMQRGKCPECNEVIGGEYHRHVGTSQPVPELTPERYNPFVARW
jgi:hypothetical protein